MYTGSLPVGWETPGANRELMKGHPERVYALQGGLDSFQIVTLTSTLNRNDFPSVFKS